jgi:predicted negative regulator of RcsB-dependent stress response
LKEILEFDVPEEIKKQVLDSLEQVRKREDSIASKSKGDELVKINQHEAAIGYYAKAIETD